MKRNRWLFIVLSLMLLVSLHTSAFADQIKVRWLMQVGSETEASQWRELAEDVTKVHPDIVVELETTDWNGYWTKLPVEIAGGNPADILYMQVLRAPSFLGNSFEPLNDYIAADSTLNLDDFNQIILQGLSVGETTYCLPYDFGAYVLFFNKTLFDAKGVPYPNENTTYEDYLDICKKLSEGDSYGAAISANIDRLVSFIWGEGFDFWQGDKFVVNDPGIAAVVQRHADLVKQGFAPQQTDTGNFNWDREQFYAGQVGMMVDGPWNLTNIKTYGDFEIGVAPVPIGSAGRLSPMNGSGFGVSSQSKNKEAAYKALAVITSSDSLGKLAGWGRALPARASVRNVYYATNDFVEGLEPVVELAISTEFSKPYLTPKNWQQVYKTINENIEMTFLGDLPAQDALDAAQAIIDGILEQ